LACFKPVVGRRHPLYDAPGTRRRPADVTKPTDDTPKGELILYETEDGRTRIECRFEGETIWLQRFPIMLSQP
jgi:hypothetical protein